VVAASSKGAPARRAILLSTSRHHVLVKARGKIRCHHRPPSRPHLQRPRRCCAGAWRPDRCLQHHPQGGLPSGRVHGRRRGARRNGGRSCILTTPATTSSSSACGTAAGSTKRTGRWCSSTGVARRANSS
jgi:hypothetical protein